MTSLDDDIKVVIDQKVATVNIADKKATCEEDQMFEQIVQTAVSNLYHSLVVSQPL